MNVIIYMLRFATYRLMKVLSIVGYNRHLPIIFYHYIELIITYYLNTVVNIP